ncbi:MAG TPA: hypothetical protein VHD33_01455, partial [Legionellaceae bacterium]|nr:hypothetical protein [Legionellaceae bacterium]
ILPEYPNVQIRMGLHPGRADLEDYLVEIIKIYHAHVQKNSNLSNFKIILPEALLSKFKSIHYEKECIGQSEWQSWINSAMIKMLRPKLPNTISDSLIFSQPLFLQTNVSGPEGAFAADRVLQAVPGALVNEAAIRGKPVYAPVEKPYLPITRFAENLSLFFQMSPMPPLTKTDLGLNKETAAEACARVMRNS